MVFGRMIVLAVAVVTTGAATAQGTAKRRWIDPPAATAVQPENTIRAGQQSAASDAPPAALTPAWPDEASRRPHPTVAQVEPEPAPVQENVTRLQEQVVEHVPDQNMERTEPAAVARVSPRKVRQLGPLAGFAAAGTSLPEEPQVQGSAGQEVSGKTSRRVQRAMSRVRVIKFRRNRVLVLFTRF